VSTTLAHPDTCWVGLDVHKNSITSAVLRPGRDTPHVDRWFPDEPSVRRFVAGLGDRARVRACYEAGPTGYDLARLLSSLGVRCEVIAPSLIPVAPGAKVKTDNRDARRLAQLYRAGELVAIRIPTIAEEGIRDLCRTRADLVIDRSRARHRLGKFLLRHGQVWRGGDNWTLRHEAWLAKVGFDDAAMDTTYRHYRAVLATVEANLEAVAADLARYYHQGPFADAVGRLSAYRGITELGALTLASEVGDWRRFGRATAAMGFCGLVPSEYSSGDRRSRGRITKAGNTHLRAQLVESAWSYQHRPGAGPVIRRRQQRCGPETVARAWAAQLHLCAKFARLSARKSSRNVVVVAVARELAGFCWAEMTAA